MYAIKIQDHTPTDEKEGESKEMNPNDKGEILETPAASQAETITTEPSNTVNSQGAVNESPEEVAFNDLKGGTQDRIKTLIRERDEARQEAVRRDQLLRSQQTYNQYPQQNLSSDPQTRVALEQVERAGVATKTWAEQQINDRIGGLIYNIELQNLERQFDGDHGMPKFDRDEYRDFVNKNPQYQTYNPKDVYNIMYSEEIMDAKLQAKGGQPQPTNSSLRPNRTTVREEQWTPESIEERLKETDGPDWYLQNKGMVNKIMASTAPKQPY